MRSLSPFFGVLFFLVSGHASAGVLTQAQAITRAGQIASPEYRMTIQLSGTDPDFTGTIQSDFNVTAQAAAISPEIFFDYADDGKILGLLLNGKTVSYRRQDGKVFIDARAFLVGHNELDLSFSTPYRSDGDGLQRSRDSADGESYLYTNFEPYAANLAFPLFDQPDLKARFHLSVVAPSKWQVIANSPEDQVQARADGTSKWDFAVTEPISSYLFAIAAGPFSVWRDITDDGIPLRLFARKSLAKYLQPDAAEWFRITKAGLKYYVDFFGVPYPFAKYDHIFCPDYNEGAMENVGAITFAENFIFRSPPTPSQVVERDAVILHEMAHMWFGDLVTMKWWDDVWLNESFATYMMARSLGDLEPELGVKGVWQWFEQQKQRGYVADRYSTAHPVVNPARDTDEGMANLDDITYRKGGSVLQQLFFTIGDTALKDGLRNYFRTYQYGNASHSDLIDSLSKAVGRDLSGWAADWLESTGTNPEWVEAKFSGGNLASLVLHQGPDPLESKLRPHHTSIGLFREDTTGALVLDQKITVDLTGSAVVVPLAPSTPAPKLILPNFDNQDFARIVLDAASVQTVRDKLGSIADPLVRQTLWSELWEMVRQGEIPASLFVGLAERHLGHEEDPFVLAAALSYLVQAPIYSPVALQPGLRDRAEALVSARLHQGNLATDLRQNVLNAYLSLAQSPVALAELVQWLGGKSLPVGISLDQSRRWTVIQDLARGNYPGVESLIASELPQDESDGGKVASLMAEVEIPTLANKRLWWSRFLGEDANFREHYSPATWRVVLAEFNDPYRPDLGTPFIVPFFAEVARLPPQCEVGVGNFAKQLFPIAYEADIRKLTQDWLTANAGIPVSLKKTILNREQDALEIESARLTK